MCIYTGRWGDLQIHSEQRSVTGEQKFLRVFGWVQTAQSGKVLTLFLRFWKLTLFFVWDVNQLNSDPVYHRYLMLVKIYISLCQINKSSEVRLEIFERATPIG